MAEPTATAPRPSLGALFLVFARISLVAFGGGSAALVLIEQEVVDRRHWLSAERFSFTYALSRAYPGIHLLAQGVLIGYLLRGLLGAVVCNLGLLAPAAVVTIVLTVSFAGVSTNPIGVAALDGLLPATAGLTLAVAYRLTQEELAGRPRGAQLVSLLLIGGAFALLALLTVNSAIVVLLTAVFGVLLYRLVGGTRGPV